MPETKTEERPILIAAVSDAIKRAWDSHAEVPFPLYGREADALARAAIETYEKWK